MSRAVAAVLGLISLGLLVVCAVYGFNNHKGAQGAVGFIGTVLFAILAAKLLYAAATTGGPTRSDSG